MLSESLDLLDAKLDNISIDDYKKANENLKEQTDIAKQQLEANQEAAKTAQKNYSSTKSAVTKKSNLETNDLAGTKKTREASKKTIKNAIANGEEIDLTLYKEGSSGYKAAVKYNAALKAQKDAIDAAALSQEEYTKTLRENAKAQFDNVQNYYEKQIELLDHQVTSIDNKISEIETSGKNVHKSYYESQKKLNEEKKKQYETERDELEKQIATIPQGTEEWYDAKDAIQECANAISECVEETYNLNNAINELHFNMFEDIADSIDRIVTEQEFLQDLFAHENLTDDKTGTLTEAGIAKLGSLSTSYYAYSEKAKKDAAEVKELQRMWDTQTLHSDVLGITFNSVDDLQDKLKEMYTQWQDDIKDTYSLESDIADMMKDKYQAELDWLKELIDAKKEALDFERDLHDYQLSLQEKTKDISTIHKQMAGISGDSSQEGLAKLQKLQVELAEKESDLRETEYDRYISDQQDMLDKLYEEYEELMTKKLEDFMTLVREGLEISNNNTSLISSYLSKVATDNGYTEETTGLFTSVSGSIEKSTQKIIDDLTAAIKTLSGTEDTSTTSSENSTNNSSGSITIDGQSHGTGYGQIGQQTIGADSVESSINDTEAIRKKMLDQAIYYVEKNATKGSKAKSELSDVNQKIYEKYNKKSLTQEQLKKLADIVGVKWNGNSKTGNLYKQLKSIKFPGFKKGGIARLVKNSGEDGITLARNGEGFIAPEHVQPIQQLVDSVPDINKLTESLANNLVPVPNILPDLIKMPEVEPVNRNIGNHDINIDLGGITMYGVNDPKEFSKQLVHTIQNDQKVQRTIRASSTDLLSGGGRLGVNKIRY